MTNDETFVADLQYMTKSVDDFRSVLLEDIMEKRRIDPETKKLIHEITDYVFSTMYRLFMFTTYNARAINNLKETLERLPSTQEFDDMRNKVMNIIRFNENERQFIEKGKRYFDDLKKDVEKHE